MEKIIIIFSILLILSVYSAKISKKLNVPLLLIFILIGVITGSDGLGWIMYDNPFSAYFIATISLCVILFTGGLQTDTSKIKPIIREGISLSVFGVIISVIVFALPIYFLTNLGWKLSLLVSSAVASTDAAAVFSLLEFSGLKLKSKVKTLIEFESGSNDPLAYVMLILCLSLINGGNMPWYDYLIIFLEQILIGGFLGFIFGYISMKLVERLNLKIQELYPILLLGLLGVTYAATCLLKGNGFLAIYILGLFISSRKFLYKNTTIRFMSVMSWIMQIILFLCLGLFSNPSEVKHLAYVGIPLAIFMVLIVRPVSVFAVLAFFKKKYSFKNKIFISAAGFKGAVAIVFAIMAMVNDVPDSNVVFNLVFFIVMLSVIMQGGLMKLLAEKLDVTEKKNQSLKNTTDTEDLEYLENHMFEMTITETSPFVNKKLSELFLPYDILITLIKRNDSYVHPKGSIKLKTGDVITIMCSEKEKIVKHMATLEAEIPPIVEKVLIKEGV